MKIDLFEPLSEILGLLATFVFVGALLSILTLVVYSFFRSLIRKLIKIESSISSDIWTLKNKEFFTVVIISYLIIGFMIWYFDAIRMFASFYGIIFLFSGPFFLLYFLSERQMEITVKIGVSIFLLLCILNLNSESYKLIKYGCLFSFGLLAYYNYKRDLKIQLIVYVALAVIYQPFIIFLLSKEAWNIIDVIVSVWLISSLIIKAEKAK